jgi:hypothetical protein
LESGSKTQLSGTSQGMRDQSMANRQSALGRRRMVNSMRPSASSRQLSTSVM